MPFDAADFPPRLPRPDRKRPGDNAVTALILVIAFALLAMPLSLAACKDIVDYLQGS